MAEDKEPESTDESMPSTDDQSDAPELDARTDPAGDDAAVADDTDQADDTAAVAESDDSDPGSDTADDVAAEADDVDTGVTAEADEDVPSDDDPRDDDPEPALVGAAARRTTSSKDVAKTSSKSAVKAPATKAKSDGKGRATPTQRRAPERERRTSPLRFASESIGELRKVVYPTTSQLRTYFVVVLVFVLFVITYVSLIDLGFGWLILKVFG